MTTQPSIAEMGSAIHSYRNLLKSFSSSQSTFRILKTLAEDRKPKRPPPSKQNTLHVLDSSFNPPTLAHLRIVLTSLTANPHPSRLLLLLAIQNADKAPKPASFEERLALLDYFRAEVLAGLGPKADLVDIDIGVTKHPYFVDKSKDIEQEEIYKTGDGEGMEQVHLIGYDTLTRLLSPKYYPPNHKLDVLVPFLEKHRLEVTYRTDDSWGDREAQDGFIEGIAKGRLLVKEGMATEGEWKEGSLEEVGGVREWVTEGRIIMVDGRQEGEEVISSTKVREAAKGRDVERLGKMVPEKVSWYIRDAGLYRDD